jgi:CheY-like chemotaxis protein
MLWLPLSEEVAVAAEGQPTAAPARSAGIALLVDDEELVRASTAQMLAELGYEVTEAISAEEALRQLEGLSPDLVVTDHLMPGMTGTELARTLRQRPSAPPILLISGYAEDRGVPDDLPRLTKPFRQAELAAALAGLGGGPPG